MFATTASRSGIVGFAVRPATPNANDLACAVYLCWYVGPPVPSNLQLKDVILNLPQFRDACQRVS